MRLVRTIRSTKSALIALNPVLLEDQIGFETDTKKWKLGDGVTPYVRLPYNIGESAYEIWLRHGNEGTEEDFLESLRGASAYEQAVKGGYFSGREDEFYKQILNEWRAFS